MKRPASTTLDWSRVRSVILPFLWPRESAGLRARVVIALRLPDRRQGDHGPGAVLLQGSGRPPERARERGARAAARGLARLRPRPPVRLRVQRAARCDLRQGRRDRRAPRVAAGVQPPVQPVAALSPGAAHGRARARDRARRRSDHLPARHRPVQHRPDPVRVRAGDRHPAGQVLLAVRIRRVRDHCRVRGVHFRRFGMAHRHPARDERARQRGQRAERRQPAQLRDGQDLHQRGLRARPSGPHPGALPERCDPFADLARRPQFRPGRDHRGRGHGDHDPGCPRRGRRAA